MRVATEYLEALARLSVNEPRVIEWLSSRLEQHTIQLVSQKDDVAVRWAQGRIQECSEIIAIIKDAAEILRKADK